MFECINRDVLLVYPKKPLIDWVNYIFPENPVSFSDALGHDEGTVYLLPEKGNIEDAIAYLKRNYNPIFERELFDWCEDKTLWPKNRSWEMFEEWLFYNIQSMVMDVCHGDIIKDDF